MQDIISPPLNGNQMLNLINLKLGISQYHMETSGEADIYGLVPIGEAEAFMVWRSSGYPKYPNPGFQVSGWFEMNNISGELLIRQFLGEEFKGRAVAEVQVPSSVLWRGPAS